MATKVITLVGGMWEKINYDDTKSSDGYIFRVDTWVAFAEKESPAWDESIPIPANTKLKFKKPKWFYLNGTAWTQVFLSPFDK